MNEFHSCTGISLTRNKMSAMPTFEQTNQNCTMVFQNVMKNVGIFVITFEGKEGISLLRFHRASRNILSIWYANFLIAVSKHV